MTLEEICCSLELAKKLKELGVKQESYFWHTVPKKNEERIYHPIVWIHLDDATYEWYSAFTTAELGEILFNHLYEISTEENGNDFNQEKYYLSTKDHGIGFMADTEVNARAKMIIYLIENGIVKP